MMTLAEKITILNEMFGNSHHEGFDIYPDLAAIADRRLIRYLELRRQMGTTEASRTSRIEVIENLLKNYGE
jgi:hypothetical protein